MKIAIIGVGQVGGALASKWAKAGHEILLGLQNPSENKVGHLLNLPRISAHSIAQAVALAEVVLLATPAKATIEVCQSLGDTQGKIIIDAMNIIMNQGPQGFTNTTEAILAHTASREVVKCFNTTGFNNMENPDYQGQLLDLFVAGASLEAKAVAMTLAKDAGFEHCYDVGGADKFDLMEAFAHFWINLAMFQGLGREIGFKLLKR